MCEASAAVLQTPWVAVGEKEIERESADGMDAPKTIVITVTAL